MKKLFANIKPLICRLTSRKEEILGKLLIRNAYTISTTESCTGGLVSSRLTDVSGSSAYIKANFITYSYDAKEKILGVKHETLMNFGAVSAECAYEMAKGLKDRTNCDIVVATTGIAGPSGDEKKPVGLVYIAVAFKDKVEVKRFELNPLITRRNMKFMFSELAIEEVIKLITLPIVD